MAIVGDHKRRALGAAIVAAAIGPAAIAPDARAESYAFLAAPHVALNRIYRVDTASGEMSACQFGLREENSVGLTLCYPAGEGAGPQVPGEYRLIGSNHQQEAGVFRVNARTGEMSICYVLNEEKVVCTPQAR